MPQYISNNLNDLNSPLSDKLVDLSTGMVQI